MAVTKVDLNELCERVAGWFHTEPALLSWVVAGSVAMLLLVALFAMVRWLYCFFGGQFVGNAAYTLFVIGGTALGAGIAANTHAPAWVGGLIGLGTGCLVSGFCCIVAAINRALS